MDRATNDCYRDMRREFLNALELETVRKIQEIQPNIDAIKARARALQEERVDEYIAHQCAKRRRT